MGIRYINAEPNLKFTRPTGFVFPVGLTQTVPANTTIDYVVVAGGGGSGVFAFNTAGGGAGGAGGMKIGSNQTVIAGSSYTVTVGAGAPISGSQFNTGSYSLFTISPANTFYHYAVGGGGGAWAQPGNNGTGGNGGSGGGGGQTGGTAGSGTPGQGNNGGNGGSPLSGGGGGAGGAGSNSVAGVGLQTSIAPSGTPTYYAGGGGGGGAQPGGLGGGGQGGGPSLGNSATNGGENTGGGGGGAQTFPGVGSTEAGSGGKGIVIIRYAGSTQRATGGTVTTGGGYTIHTFTGDGTFATNADFGAAQFSIN